MEAIETITSSEVTTYLPVPGGGKRRALTTHVWNATVANLTLMALGSSAPEILLSVIEICGNSFYSGELGPSTIVGSAAFNLMVISAVCVLAIPNGEGRYVKQQSVFMITCFFSLFAYLWLAAILTYFTPNIIDVWEGVLTLFYFPLLVYLAYLADIGAIRSSGSIGSAVAATAVRPASGSSRPTRRVTVESSTGLQSALVHTAAYYRMNATREAVGGADVAKWKMRKETREAKEREERAKGHVAFASSDALEAGKGKEGGGSASKKGGAAASAPSASFMAATGASKARRDQTVDKAPSVIELGGAHYSVRDSLGWLEIPVYRTGSLTAVESIGYTVSLGKGGAKSAPGQPPVDLVEAEGRVNFEPSQQSATIRIELLPGDLALQQAEAEGGEPPAALYVMLKEPSRGASLGGLTKASVRLLDGQAPGVLCLDQDTVRVNESSNAAVLTLRREDGKHGVVSCVVSTKDGSAVAPADYDAIEGQTITFADGEVEKQIAITIHNDDHFEGDETFTVIFSDATGGATFSYDCDGGPERAVATVTIECDDTANAGGCDAVLVSLGVNADLWQQVGLDWVHQLEDALQFDGELQCSTAGFLALIFFALAVPWRLVFALAPPPRLFGGWACFIVALGMIGGLTALVGDFASTLGCCLGISKSVTAITFVALGTSLPDTFASMLAAKQEPHADNSLGNITGSNSVNVFLGLGMPWAIAAIYWHFKSSTLEGEWRATYGGEEWYTPDMAVGFAVPAGSLGFSVMVFVACAILTIASLFLRRSYFGYELGGDPWWAMATAVFFVGLWLVYIVASIVQEGM